MPRAEHEQEGVIKYQLQFQKQVLSENFFKRYSSSKTSTELLGELNSARRVLKNKGLMGQDPSRYGGDGFGNISTRVHDLTFLVSGSQTGHLDVLSIQDLALVDHFDIYLNRLTAYGLTQPSSESMTHGVCYQADASLKVVIHVHSPDIWQVSDALNLPFTEQSIPYGTPQMAQAVTELLKVHYHAGQVTLFAMKGHQDGIVVVGGSMESCTSSLLDCLDQSISVKRHSG